jgi:predicted Zn-dependent protease
MIGFVVGSRSWRFRCIWALILFLFLNSCRSAIAPILPAARPSLEDEETRISREFRREAKKQFKFTNHPEVERFVDRIGRRILAATGPLSFEYRFFVVEENQLNAFAVPGGSIYLFTGLIERAKSTDEIAGVLGHEIVHIKGRHMSRSSGPDAISILSILSMALLARSASGAQAAGVVGQAVAAARQAAYSRQLELESDTLGARYMAAAGFNPRGTIDFLKTLDQERALNPIDVPAYILTHPITQERVANAELVVKSLGPTQARPDDSLALKKVQIIIRMDRPDRGSVVAEYQNLVKQNPTRADLLHLLAFSQQLSGDLPSAKKNYDRAIQLKPDDPGLQRDLGRWYTQAAEYGAARAAFERASALEPKEPLTFLYLGEMLEKSGDLRGAAGAYLNAQNLAPLWDRPPQRLGTVYSKLDRLGDAYYYLGRSFLLQDEDERAIADYEKALKIVGPNTPRGQVIRDELRILKERNGIMTPP